MLRTTDFLYGVGFSLLGSDNMVQIFDEILEWKFCVDAFSREISGMSKKLVTATLEVYKAAVTEQLPRPLTVRYAFNLPRPVLRARGAVDRWRPVDQGRGPGSDPDPAV